MPLPAVESKQDMQKGRDCSVGLHILPSLAVAPMLRV